ncbi:hypothetical protein AMI01nite_37280 [Aneurinibacillus migulanus]|nr:hypothetical protein AMI01nite_37280 [Aneurinibacillus migulanus]
MPYFNTEKHASPSRAKIECASCTPSDGEMPTKITEAPTSQTVSVNWSNI